VGLVPETEHIAMPIERTDPAASAVVKGKARIAKKIQSQIILSQSRQPVNRLSKINRLPTRKNSTNLPACLHRTFQFRYTLKTSAAD